MKIRMNRTELLRYVVERVLQEDKNPETSHILWDWSCDFMEYAKWTCNPKYTFYIWVRKHGLESGTLEEVTERCASLGQPYLKMKITYSYVNFEDVYELTIE